MDQGRLTMISSSTVLLSFVSFLAAAGTAPAEAAKGPSVTASVPAACADVWKEVYPQFDKGGWKVTVLDPREKDLKVPVPEVLESFVTAVPGLSDALASMDALDRDLFYVRVRGKSLAELKRHYPKIEPATLRAAKLQACRDVAAETGE